LKPLIEEYGPFCDTTVTWLALVLCVHKGAARIVFTIAAPVNCVTNDNYYGYAKNFASHEIYMNGE